MQLWEYKINGIMFVDIAKQYKNDEERIAQEILKHISSALNPNEVFSEETLRGWAFNNGFKEN